MNNNVFEVLKIYLTELNCFAVDPSMYSNFYRLIFNNFQCVVSTNNNGLYEFKSVSNQKYYPISINRIPDFKICCELYNNDDLFDFWWEESNCFYGCFYKYGYMHSVGWMIEKKDWSSLIYQCYKKLSEERGSKIIAMYLKSTDGLLIKYLKFLKMNFKFEDILVEIQEKLTKTDILLKDEIDLLLKKSLII